MTGVKFALQRYITRPMLTQRVVTRMIAAVMEFTQDSRSVDRLIADIRSYMADEGLSRTALAERAQISESTIRHIDSDDWNPTVETLRKLETAMKNHPRGSNGKIPSE
jgi:ribosome-binding protein aMBF1 (putative translation factor)